MKKVFIKYLLLLLVGFAAGFFFKPQVDHTKLVEEYQKQISALEYEVASIELANEELYSLIGDLESRYSSNIYIIDSLNSSIEDVKKQTQDSISKLSNIGDDELEQFLTNWVLSRTDTIK